MADTEHYYTKFYSGNFYHVYNRSVDRQPMFKSDDNYRFFLKQYDHYLSQVIETYAYCLLGNHFHLLVRVPDLTTFQKLSNLKEANPEEADIHSIVSHQFRKFFQSYAMAFNKQQNRTGTLFQTPFKRTEVDNDHYFTQLVYYIHANPQLHGLIDDFRDWKWSSYGSILLDKPTKLKREEVINWFGNTNSYSEFHSTNQKIIYNQKYILED
jgi:putative transposase